MQYVSCIQGSLWWLFVYYGDDCYGGFTVSEGKRKVPGNDRRCHRHQVSDTTAGYSGNAQLTQVDLSNGIGPVLGAVFSEKASWR